MAKIAFCLIAFVSVAYLGACARADTVLELDDETFKPKLSSIDNALVMFYAPWCGHCKKLKPEFAKASDTLSSNDPPVTLAKVDCTEGGKKLCEQHGVSGYPTLKMFSSGEFAEDYNGPREAAGIVQHVKGKIGPAFKTFKDLASLDKFVESEQDTAVVVAYALKTEKNDATFQSVAKALRDSVIFAKLDVDPEDKKLKERISNVKSSLAIHRPIKYKSGLEPNIVPFADAEKDEFVKADFRRWVEKERHGLVGHRTPLNQGEFVGMNKHMVVAYFNVDYKRNAKGANYWRNRIMKVAKEFADKDITFAISDSADLQREVNEFGIEYMSKDDKPRVTLLDEKRKKFVMKDEFSVDNLKKFLTDFLAGKLEVYMKSEPIPDDNDDKGVKVAVAKNFQELVMDSKKDTLIEFYAPWCGHCKSLAPIYDELGDKMKSEPGVQIVKMDATANDVPEPFNVRGFPTLYWLPADQKNKPHPYQGGRTLEDFIKYIAEKATTELNSYTRSGEAKKIEL